jgi:hypothetical protein
MERGAFVRLGGRACALGIAAALVASGGVWAADDPDRAAVADRPARDAGAQAPSARAEAPRAEQSDAAITSDVQAKLRAAGAREAGGITVETTKKIVTLKGQVSSEAERMRAVKAALTADGIYGVLDELTVPAAPSAPGPAAGAVPAATGALGPSPGAAPAR